MNDDKTHKPNREDLPRVTFVNRFYAPDLSATSQILSDVAEHLATCEFSISIVCSRLSYEGKGVFPKSEHRNGVRINRVWTTKFGRDSTIGRAIDYLTFYLSCFFFLLEHLRRDEILIAKTDPPMLSIPLGLVAKLKRAKIINWLQDIFPEVATQIGVTGSTNLLVRSITRIRNRSLIKADTNVAIGTRMAEQVQALGVAGSRIRIIHNFVDDLHIAHQEAHSNALRSQWGISDSDFVVGYSGNLGRAHDLLTILDVATNLQMHDNIKFLFIGGGHLHERLNQEITQRSLRNLILRPYQPRDQLPVSLALPNLHWASLLPSLEGYILPSKVYGIAAVGRPLLMIGDQNGEIGRLVTQHRFGQCFAPGDSASAERFIIDLMERPDKSQAMGRNARRFIDDRGTRQKAFDLWRETIVETHNDL